MENQLPPLPPSVAVDEAYINGMYLGLSFHSLLTYGSPPCSSSSFDDILKTPKCEPLFSDEPPPYKFFSGETPPHNFFSGSSSSHHKIPNLASLELPPPTPPHAAVVPPPEPPKKRQRALISDKIRALQKLLPCEKKMCMATVLEETYKYVKFLQAQVSVLRSMPEKSSRAVDYGCGGGGGGLAGVGRAELLQVMVNSPAVQAVLCADGCCVYSSEQVEVMKEIAERNAAFDRQMMVFDNAHSALYY